MVTRFMFVLVGVVVSMGAAACQCHPWRIEDSLRTATTVIRADVIGAKRVHFQRRYFLQLALDRVAVLKGKLDRGGVKTPMGNGACGAKVSVPETYWLFLDGDGVFYSCGGAVTAFAAGALDLELMLQALKKD